MEDLNAIKERIAAQRREIEKHRQAVIADLGPKAKPTPSPVCCACGGYVQKPAKYLSEKYRERFDETPYCIYCLSRALERDVDELKAEYKSDT